MNELVRAESERRADDEREGSRTDDPRLGADSGASSGAPGSGLPQGLFAGLRAAIGRSRGVERVYRILVGATGAGVALLGLLLVPLPGPGWLVVFAGLALLGSEFAWARPLAAGLRRALERFWAWWRARREARRRDRMR